VKELTGVRALDAGREPWSTMVLQACEFADPSKAKLPRSWYERQVGVQMSMLGEEGTMAYTATTPLPLCSFRDKQGKPHTEEVPSEVGGVTVCVRRTAPCTTFAALHEPFERGQHRIAAFRRIQQVDDALAVAVVGRAGSGIDDRAMVRFGDDGEQPVTLGGDGESFTFGGFAFIRIGRDQVEAAGDLRAATIKVQGEPRLILNGKAVRSQARDGLLRYVSAEP
jgi:hypothetical protein